jgi:hypothetical protein
MDANGSDETKRDWLAFGRTDYVGTRIILGVAVVGSVLFGLGGPVVAAATNAPLAVSYTTTIPNGIELPRGATHAGDATMEMLINDATFGERVTQALPEFLVAGLTIAVAWMLHQLLRSTQAREPFTRRNVRRINTIALVVGLGWILAQFAQGVADNAIQTTGRLPDRGGLTFVFTFTPVPLVVMLVIALIGEVFRRGVQLRDDVEGLV